MDSWGDDKVTYFQLREYLYNGRWPSLYIYHLVFSHSHGKSPFLIGKPSISMGHLYHGYVKYITMDNYLKNSSIGCLHPRHSKWFITIYYIYVKYSNDT